jgi:hypothetical protein
VVIAVFGLAYYSAETNITEQEVEGNNDDDDNNNNNNNNNNKYIEQKPQDKPHMKDPKTSRNSQHDSLPWWRGGGGINKKRVMKNIVREKREDVISLWHKKRETFHSCVFKSRSCLCHCRR